MSEGHIDPPYILCRRAPSNDSAPQVFAGAPQACAAKQNRRRAPVVLHDARDGFTSTSGDFPYWRIMRQTSPSDDRRCRETADGPILAVPGQSEPSRKRPFVPIARLLPYGDRWAAPDKVASSRISPNLIRNGSVALARRWGDRRRKSLRISHVELQSSPVSVSHSVEPLGRRPADITS